MKKLIAWILMLCMVMGLLCGCSDDDSSSSRRSKRKNKDKDKESVEDCVDDEDRDDDEDRGDEIQIDDEDQDDDELIIEEDEDEDDQKEGVVATVEGAVLYDDNGIKVTWTGMDENSSCKNIKLHVENNTDKTVAFLGEIFVVNGITMEGVMYIDLEPGEAVDDIASLYQESLKEAGIEQIATVTCVDSRVLDLNSYETVCELPFAIATSIADGYVQQIDDSGEVIYQGSGVTLIAKSLSYGSMGTRMVVLVKNETGEDITITIEDVVIDDVTVDAWMFDTVLAGSVSFCALTVYSSDLKDNNIEPESVDAVSFVAELRYAESWETICETDMLTVSAN